jgi:hypothetical protein
MTNVAPLYTLPLSLDAWDLMTDGAGNCAPAIIGDYALAQDVASACMLFLAEAYYDETQGVDYESFLGRSVPLSQVTDDLEAAALTVPGIVQATVVVTDYNRQTREVTGQIQCTDVTGTTFSVQL